MSANFFVLNCIPRSHGNFFVLYNPTIRRRGTQLLLGLALLGMRWCGSLNAPLTRKHWAVPGMPLLNPSLFSKKAARRPQDCGRSVAALTLSGKGGAAFHFAVTGMVTAE